MGSALTQRLDLLISQLMKQQLLIFILLLTGASCLSGQVSVVQGTIEHAGDGQIYLASYYGDRFRIIDSMETSSLSLYLTGRILKFSLHQAGMVRHPIS